jgi:energy-coupling factor transporter ATP-binding protein EcfA2
VRGRTANLIDLTAGFHPELTGRENVYLQAALLGMSRREVQTRFDAIVEFADIGAFLDTPVKKYSAGMLARIGFSIAIHTEPDVLLVDEVLAVGDARFQSKCLRRIRAMRERGVATVLVSHNMAAITALATHVLWLDQGKIRARGQALDVVDAYLRHSAKANEEEAAGRSFPVQDNGPLRVESVRLLSGNTPAKDFKFRDALSVEICYFAKEPVERPFFTVAAVRDGLTLFHASMRWDGHAPERIEGRGVLRCTFESLPLHPGVYQMVLRVSDPTMSFTYIPTMPIGMFQIVSPLSAYGYREETAVPVVHDSPYIAVPYRWEHRAEKTPHD